jgi:DNA-binding NtrC family response regulator
VEILAQYFLDRFCREAHKTLMLSPAAIDELRGYSWPGNVRELQNCIERAVILAEGDSIQPRHLNNTTRQPVPAVAAAVDPWDQIDLSGTLNDAVRRVAVEVERRKIVKAIKDAGGNKVQAADTLQVGVKVLATKLRQHAIPE